jgi:hypothetical protein
MRSRPQREIWSAACVWLAIALGACGSSREAGDASVELARCQLLDQQIRDALAQPGTCDVDTDCAMIGGQLDAPTCNCAAYVLDCAGQAIESNTPGLPRARALISEYMMTGCATRTACDCAPRGPVHCGADHRCTAAARACFPAPDAGESGW